ncbi:MAG: ATP-binding protein, partial [Pseudomonadota bacterium]
PDFSNQKQKRKFLGLVSSFANTVGGDIIYGVSEEREEIENGRIPGRPGEITGVQTDDSDELIRQIKDIILNNIEPRIVPQVVARAIHGFDLGPVIVIRVRRSATGPHAVWMDKKALFYVRSSNSTDLMDVNEIRMSFTMKESLIDRMKAFRQERIDKILTGDTPIPVENGAKLLLHVLPIEAFDPMSRINILGESNYRVWDFMPYEDRAPHHRTNFDGVLLHRPLSDKGTTWAYSQIFEDGKIEIVDTMIAYFDENTDFITRKFDENIIINTIQSLDYLAPTGVTCPLLIMVTFLSVRNFRIDIGRKYGSVSGEPIDRDNLVFPEIFVNSFNEDPYTFLKPTLDSFWRACGFSSNLNYDKRGNRVV